MSKVGAKRELVGLRNLAPPYPKLLGSNPNIHGGFWPLFSYLSHTLELGANRAFFQKARG
jgi:hypothetical protein